MTNTRPSMSEREHTDESLRAEREVADGALEESLETADETADAVVIRARARADALLAATRAQSDESRTRHHRPAGLDNSRAREDAILEDERFIADNILSSERAEHVALLRQERKETDRDLANERVRSDAALTTRDEFMGIVSHDLRNMLTAMVGVASLIEKDSGPNHDEHLVARARRIQRSGARMQRLVGDLVDVASIEAGRLAVTREFGDLTSVVEEAVQTFEAHASSNGITLELDVVQPLARTAFDPARILQVLSNLLSNAIKFTPAQGTVTVRVHDDGNELVVGVSDTGEGMPGDKLEVVFDRFVQLTKNDRRGVGLGLFISKCIIEAHDGRIWAENRSGPGSIFSFTLPIHEPNAATGRS